MVRRPALFGLLALAGAATAAEAQDATGVQQLSPTVAGASASAQQVSSPVAPLAASTQPVDRTLAETPPPRSASRPGPESQLTGERRRTDAGVQLSAGEPDAGPSATAAQRLAGRNTAVDRPRGPDRCDPRAEDEQRAQVCARVIETRAGEFPAPDPEPLSAEQRLMVAQRELNPMSREVGTAARRLADGNIDESNAALAVASVALGQGARPTDDDEETPAADTSVTDAIVAGVLAAVGQTPTP